MFIHLLLMHLFSYGIIEFSVFSLIMYFVGSKFPLCGGHCVIRRIDENEKVGVLSSLNVILLDWKD